MTLAMILPVAILQGQVRSVNLFSKSSDATPMDNTHRQWSQLGDGLLLVTFILVVLVV